LNALIEMDSPKGNTDHKRFSIFNDPAIAPPSHKILKRPLSSK
jgi:hypothetical protein